MISVVSFDLGGTILNTCGTSFVGGLSEILGITKQRAVWIVKKFLMVKRMSVDEAIQILNEEVMEKRIHVELLKEYIQGYQSSYYIYDDVIEVLKILKEKGYILIAIANHCCIGDTKENILPEFFEHEFYSFDIGYAKPAPEIYRYVEKALHMEGVHFLHVGDSVGSDIMGPHLVGWKAALLIRDKEKQKYLPKTHGQAPDYIIGNMYEIIEILGEEFNGEQ